MLRVLTCILNGRASITRPGATTTVKGKLIQRNPFRGHWTRRSLEEGPIGSSEPGIIRFTNDRVLGNVLAFYSTRLILDTGSSVAQWPGPFCPGYSAPLCRCSFFSPFLSRVPSGKKKKKDPPSNDRHNNYSRRSIRKNNDVTCRRRLLLR